MPVKCKLIRDKWRVVSSHTERIEQTDNGNPRDGGGHNTKEQCQAQASAINMAAATMNQVDRNLHPFVRTNKEED